MASECENSEVDNMLASLICCISDDGHFCEEPVLLRDQCNACRKCILELNCFEVQCRTCNALHDSIELRNAIDKENLELVRKVKQSDGINRLFSALREQFKDTVKNMEGLIFSDNIENNLSFIESEVEIRIESLKIQLDEFGESFREKLKEIKDQISVLISNETLRQLPEKLVKLHDGFNINLDDFYVYQNELRACRKQIDELRDQLPKMSFDWSEIYLEKSIVGKLSLNYCEFSHIKSFKSYELPGFSWFARMKLMNDRASIMVTDRRHKSLSIVDLNGNFLRNFQEQNLFAEPFAVCTNHRNEIFVGDHIDKHIFVFDEHFRFLKRFGNEYLIESSAFAIDDEDETTPSLVQPTIDSPLLYVTSKFMNTVTVWNSDSGEYVTKFKINKPEYIRVHDKKLYVVGRLNNPLLYTASQDLNDSTKNVVYSSNCIYVVNKTSFELVHTVSLKNWFDLKGLHVDSNLNIFTCGREFQINDTVDEARNFNNQITTSKSRYLYVFQDKMENCVQKTTLDPLKDLSDMLVLRNKIIFCHRDSFKIIEFM